ncbi:MAG: gluconate 2-dehydrogenase subunit 3 family protein [Imperialibacter sp.]
MEPISRRDSLKYITLASLSASALIACEPGKEGEMAEHVHPTEMPEGYANLTPEVMEMLNQKFFTDEERQMVKVLANLVIPADDKSGSAEDALTTEFIEFTLIDREYMQTPIRGGLRWMNIESTKRFGKNFTSISEVEQKQILDDIAYPQTASPAYSQGVAFFSTFRSLVLTGFFSSKLGVEDLQYMGNRPTVWNGAPQEWLDRLGVSYDA